MHLHFAVNHFAIEGQRTVSPVDINGAANGVMLEKRKNMFKYMGKRVKLTSGEWRGEISRMDGNTK